jgi:AcrR family transcriptional regulator
MLISHQFARQARRARIREETGMPAPEKTTVEAIVAAARDLAERRGVDGVTMLAVAEAVGVRAPSLYKRVRDRDELLALVVAENLDDLTGRLAVARDPDPRRSVAAQAEALRAFAHAHPVGYALVFASHGTPRPELDAVARSVTPLLDAVTALVGPEHAPDAARLVAAWANGFITMELGSSLRLGGDIDAAWRWGLERIVGALG